MEGFVKKTIGGVTRSFQFDLKAFGLILKDLGCGLADIGGVIQNPFFSFPIILYHGAIRALEKEGQEIDFTQDDVYEWFDKEDDGILCDAVQQVIRVFVDSVSGLMPKPKVKEKKEQAVPNGGKKAPKSTGKGT